MFSLRRRHIFTRHDRLRLRYVTSALALLLTTGFASYKKTDWSVTAQHDVPQQLAQDTSQHNSYGFASALASISDKINALTNVGEGQRHKYSAVDDDLDSLNAQILTIDKMASHSSSFDSIMGNELATAPAAIDDAADDSSVAASIEDFADDAQSQDTLAAFPAKPDMARALAALKKSEKSDVVTMKVSRGDTLSGILQDAGVGVRDTVLSIRAMGKDFDPRRIKIGQEIRIQTSLDKSGTTVLDQLTLPLSVAKSVTVQREDDAYKSTLHEKEIVENVFAKSIEIDSSLYASAARIGIPAQVIADLIRVYSWDVDFQREIRSGDELEVMYTVQETEDGEFVKYGNVSYANLTMAGKKYPIYRFETSDGDVDYFEPSGHSIRKTLMKTPVDGARLSSGFGMRRHPVLGYGKMHKGVDFAAPTGTPIYAAGDGKVEYAARYGSYGNYIRIRHNGSLKTAYAHLHKFAKSTRKGSYVKQGQIIGYIGTTGRSTGPHLHYEVLKNNVQVSPNRVDLPVGEILKGTELARFQDAMSSTKQEFASILSGVKVASSQSVGTDAIQ